MSSFTAAVLRHKLIVVLIWIAVAVAGFATISSTTGRLAHNFALPGDVANNRLAALYPSGGDQKPTVVVVTLPAGQRASDPPVATQLARTFAAAAKAAPSLRVIDQASTGDTHFATADGRTAIAVVSTPPSRGPKQPDLTHQIRQLVTATAPPGWQIRLTGLSQLQSSGGGGGTGVLAETLIGGIGALVVLAFVFGSFLALLPLLMALAAIPAAFLAVLGLTQVTPVSFVVQFLVALIGLGVAIDYSLLVVTRWREHRSHGADNIAAVTAAMASAGRAVVFSGLTVAVSLLALVVLPVPFLRSVGFAGFFIPLVSIAVASTLLPVMLATIGPRLDWPRLRHEASASRPWTAWARFVVRHAKPAGAVGAAILVALLVPLLSIRTGQPASASLARSGPAHMALADMTAGGIPSGVITPIEVLTRSGAATTVARSLDRLPGVDAALAPAAGGYHSAGTAIVEVLPVAETSSPAGRATINRVQHALHGNPAVLAVGGTGEADIAFNHAVYGNFPLMLALIALLTLILLTRAFRSVVLAAKAVIFNLLSVGAAYGVMALVWQMGHGSQTIWNVAATGSITIWVPVMVFAFLFGLSMDYEVFIISRIREEHDAGLSTTDAVVAGIGRTGRLVTSAALILFLSFVSLSTSPETDLKVLATGLGAGILLDAVVIRTLLVPAMVTLLGRWNWWLPSALA